MSSPARKLALLAVALLASGVTGCAASGSTTGTSVSTHPTTAAAPCPSGQSTDVRTVTDADSGSTICLAVGARLEVYLHSTLADMWSPINLGGSALAPQANGKGTLPVGVTGGFFIARVNGQAHLSSSRSACPTPSTPPTSCGRRQFALDVMVG